MRKSLVEKISFDSKDASEIEFQFAKWNTNNEDISTNVNTNIRDERKKRRRLIVKELFLDYTNNTGLHGLPYIARKGISLIERYFWFFTFIVSLVLCSYLIGQVWFKWQNSPVIVTVSEELVPVGKVPFPSVTICPQSKSKVSAYNYSDANIKIYSFIKNKDKDSKINSTMAKEIEKYLDVSQICGYFVSSIFNLDEVYPQSHSDSSVFKHIYDVRPNYTDIFSSCRVRGEFVLCEKLFSEVVTQEGICYNMNSIAADDIFRTQNMQQDFPYLSANQTCKGWSLEDGYSGSDDLYPIPGAENGAFPDVEVLLHDYSDDRDQLCNVKNTGFKVYIQHPADFPQSSLYYYAVLDGQVSSMALSFSILNTMESLRRYNPEIRQCFFSDERYLKYFKIYTANNCKIECLSNITFETCGCVKLYMPHESSTRICTTKHYDCLLKAREKLQFQELRNSTPKCHCLPSCNSVDYDAEILKTEYNLNKFFNAYYGAMYYLKGDSRLKYSKLEMYFKRPRFVSMRRSELFGVVDFLANCGGLLGLFLGFSFLSLVEIFYFLTLRLCCTLKKDLEENKTPKNCLKEIETEKY